MNLPAVGQRDPLTFRVEALRVFLGQCLGEKAFLELYRNIVDARSADASMDLSKSIRKALGKQKGHKGLLPLVFQLIHSEEIAFGGHSGR